MGWKFWMDSFVNKAIHQTARILEKIEERCPGETNAEEAGASGNLRGT
jgi:hypothetical protein